LDKPAELVDGQAQLVPGIWERLLEQDNMHLIVRYLSRPTRLRGIKFVNGVGDFFNPIRDVRALSERMRELGIAHTYVEHSGGHAFLPEESLGFMSRVLNGELPQIQSATLDLGTIVAGQPVPEVTVVLSAPPEATGKYPKLSLDLSSLGVSEALPMQHDGNGRYTARPTLTPNRTGPYLLSVSLDEGTATPFPLFQVSLTVWPAGDVPVIADAVAEGWTIEGQSKVTLDTQASAQVYQGRSALAVQTNGVWRVILSPAQPLSPLGYTALRFAFHPGDASGDALDLYIGPKKVSLWPGKPGGVTVDLAAKTWQVVEIPLDALELDPYNPIASVRFSGRLNGTFYLDDLRLVASAPPPPPPPTAVLEDHAASLPQRFALDQNYPNPFNSETVIRFALPASAKVELALYNLAGQKVAILVQGTREAGAYTVRWDSHDDSSRELASGVYLYRLQAGASEETRKLLLLR
jgi:hypothetical protein